MKGMKERYEKELQCSRFVGELLMNKVAMKENARVRHNTYGTGKIIKVEDGKITIKFDKNPVPKVLSLEFCVQNQILQVIIQIHQAQIIQTLEIVQQQQHQQPNQM